MCTKVDYVYTNMQLCILKKVDIFYLTAIAKLCFRAKMVMFTYCRYFLYGEFISLKLKKYIL